MGDERNEKRKGDSDGRGGGEHDDQYAINIMCWWWRWWSNLPSHLDVADDLEDGGSADDKDEKSDEPWGGWVLVLGWLQALGNISAVVHVLGELLVSKCHTLLWGHVERLVEDLGSQTWVIKPN